MTTSFVLVTDIAMWDHRDIHPQGEFFQSTLFNDSSVPIQFTSKRYNRRYWGISHWPELSHKCEHPAARIRNSKPPLKIRAEPCSH